MTADIYNYPDFCRAVQSEPLVYLFGTGISAALTGQKYSWRKWIADGIHHMKDSALKAFYEKSLNDDGERMLWRCVLTIMRMFLNSFFDYLRILLKLQIGRIMCEISR